MNPVRREFAASLTSDRVSWEGREETEALVRGLVEGLRAKGLRVDSPINLEIVDDHDLIYQNKIRIVATVEAEGLLPEERLPQGWRAFFCAP